MKCSMVTSSSRTKSALPNSGPSCSAMLPPTNAGAPPDFPPSTAAAAAATAPASCTEAAAQAPHRTRGGGGPAPSPPPTGGLGTAGATGWGFGLGATPWGARVAPCSTHPHGEGLGGLGVRGGCNRAGTTTLLSIGTAVVSQIVVTQRHFPPEVALLHPLRPFRCLPASGPTPTGAPGGCGVVLGPFHVPNSTAVREVGCPKSQEMQQSCTDRKETPGSGGNRLYWSDTRCTAPNGRGFTPKRRYRALRRAAGSVLGWGIPAQTPFPSHRAGIRTRAPRSILQLLEVSGEFLLKLKTEFC